MNKKTIFFSFCIGVILFAGCKKTTDNSDLTTTITGHYTNTASSTDIVVTKVSNNTIAITLLTGSGSGAITVSFPLAKMNSVNSFTLDTVTQTNYDNNSCYGTSLLFYGTGSGSNNNINMSVSINDTCAKMVTPVPVSASK